MKNTEGARSGWVRSSQAVTAALSLVLCLFVFGRYFNLSPELDAMVTYREALRFHSLWPSFSVFSEGAGVHPPLLDVLASSAFSVLGRSPGALNVLGVALLVLMAGCLERLLSRTMSVRGSVPFALLATFSPSVAVNVFLLMREGLLVVILAVFLACATSRRTSAKRAAPWVLAIAPLAKETGLVFVAPFALWAFFTAAGPAVNLRSRVLASLKAGLPVVLVAGAWKWLLWKAGGRPWAAWVFTDDKTESPYVSALRSLRGDFGSRYFEQNFANAFLVNFGWVVAALVVIGTIASLLALRSARVTDGGGVHVLANTMPSTHGNTEDNTNVNSDDNTNDNPAAGRFSLLALLLGFLIVYVAAVFPFPTWTIPRYATPAALLALLFAIVALSHAQIARAILVAVLTLIHGLGFFASLDPITRLVYGMTVQGGERIYDLNWDWRGPDRIMLNGQILAASARGDRLLTAVFESPANRIVGYCGDMKLGEKLWSIGLDPTAYPRYPRARAVECIEWNDVPARADRKEFDGVDVFAILPDGMSEAPTYFQNSRTVTIARQSDFH